MQRLSTRSSSFLSNRGLNVALDGAPEQLVRAGREVSSVALVMDDHPGLRADLCVEVGDRVRLGDPMLRSRERPEVILTAPGSGRVSAIERGSRRALRAVVVELDGTAQVEFPVTSREALAALSSAEVQERLLKSGLWTALRERPFGCVADPQGSARALFVTAIDTDPLSADPAHVLSEVPELFEDGLRVLSRLREVPVFVCSAGGVTIPGSEVPGVTFVEFDGPHPAGLPGTHMHRLAPVGRNASNWQLGYQDVVAVGRLFTSGRLDVERVVALAGSQVTRPRLLRARLGANLDDLVQGELRPGACRVISGSVLSGREAAGWGRYLGRHHLAVTVLGAHEIELHGRRGPHVPLEEFERVMPHDLLIAPLLRALLIGDVETAEALGCLELIEEDLALCSYVCPGKLDYGAHLRAVLNLLGGAS